MSERLLLVAFSPVDVVGGAGFAQALGLPYDALCLTGEGPLDAGADKLWNAGLDRIPPADRLASALQPLVAGYSHVAAVSSMRAKDVLARLAGLLDAAMVTDAVAVESPTVFVRPVVAGSLLARVEVLSTPVFLTVRPANFPPARLGGSSTAASLALDGAGTTEILREATSSGTRPDLTQAKVVVSGGRPMKDRETFESVIGGLADALGGAAGATRAAVDAGIAPNELQVGQTGKIVAPDLYIAAGVSGSTQHMAGIKDSKLIVAINKDPDAPIFEIADVGIVADLYEVIPKFRQLIGK